MLVEKVILDGDAFVSESAATKSTEELFLAKTLDEITHSSLRTAQTLCDLGISKACQVTLDTDESDNVVVRLNLSKAPSVSAKVGTSISAHNADLSASVSLKNIYGGGENFNLSISQDSSLQDTLDKPSQYDAGKTFQATYDSPVNANPDDRFQISASSSTRNLSDLSSYHQENTSFAVKYLLLNRVSGNHEFEYAINLRNNVPGKDASWNVRVDAGHSLKSCLSHTLTFDSRNDPLLAQSGIYLKSRHEVAGAVGDIHHIKSETNFQQALSFSRGFFGSISLRNGFLLPFYKNSRINDRFFTGGPQTIRGFKQSSLGPKDHNDVLGGDIYYNACASLFTPIPFLPTNGPVFGHFFANSGNLISLRSIGGLKSFSEQISSGSRLSVGVGIALRFSVLRAEFNYVLPIRANSSDVCKTGFQFGIGVDFC